MTAKVETQKILVKADRSLVLTERIPIVEGNVAVDQVEFTFEEPADWQDLSIFAYFTNSANETTEHVNLGTLGSATKKMAQIPANVTQDVGFIGVALQGAIIDESGDEPVVEQRATTQENKTILKVYKSGVVVYNPDPESPIAPSVLEEVEQRLAEAIAATEEANQSISQHNDPFVGATDETAGDKGLVPAPAAGETDLVLTGDGEWTDVHDLIPDKADIDGYYELLTAGAADNLTGRGDGVSASFLYRTAGGSEDIADGVATVKAIYGETVGWNQLYANNRTPYTAHGVTFTNGENGTVTINGTSDLESGSYNLEISLNISVVQGHKYLLKGYKVPSSAQNTRMDISGWCKEYGNGAIGTSGDTADNYRIRIYFGPGASFDNLTITPQFFDLTQIFGAGNEPATVEEFEALYPLPYYPYNPGSLKPVQMTGIETRGFNQLDHENVVMRQNYNLAVGSQLNVEPDNKATISGDNPIVMTPTANWGGVTFFSEPLIANATYKFEAEFTKSSGNRRFSLYLVDENNIVLWHDYSSSALVTLEFAEEITPTQPNSRFAISVTNSDANGTITISDMCLHLKWSGYRDGEYESYWNSQRAIDVAQYFPTGLKGINDECRDALYEDHADTVVGSVDLSTCEWIKSSTVGYERFYTKDIRPLVKKPSANTAMTNIECNRFVADTASHTYARTTDNAISVDTSGDVYVYASAYIDGDAETFKASLSGVILYYELATPTTVEIDPPLNMQFKVSDFGTEKIMVPDGEISAPPTMQIVYGLNAVDAIRTTAITTRLRRWTMPPSLRSSTQIGGTNGYAWQS